MQQHRQILIYGYGNPGRQDDGLGNHFVEMAKEWAAEQGLDNIMFDSNYQLNIEDAAEIAEKDIVIFVDASLEEIDDFVLDEITPDAKVEFSMHAVSASYVVHLCKEIYPKCPAAWLLHIKGYEWEFREGLTEQALNNCNKAFEYLKPILQNPQQLLEH
ncbi:MAG: hydrogenase maturation protease [Clostridia bacterium]|nr:hydrogenase maturation protease [Clostridia bacterium]